jgi:outer membrane protein TolC
MVPVVRNMFREVEIALDARPEVREARLAVENARIQIGVAKNQALPSLDFVVRHAVNGLGANADSSFDQMTSYNFYDTMVSLEFAWSFGERAERAGVRIAALQHSQAVAGFKQAIDAIITDVRATIRNLEVSHKQIAPSADGVDSALKSLRSILERAEDLSPERINSIFSAQSQVANSRQALLQAIISYNQAIIDVERSKGTLLDYNNIHLTELP